MEHTAAPYFAEFPRLYELKAAVPNPAHPDAYFQTFEERLQQSEHVRYVFKRVEPPLDTLDDCAWADIKERATPLTMVRHPERGWESLFNTLHEAQAYAYLKSRGYVNVAFIKPRKKKRTPDLTASCDGQRVLCEVKTINISKAEADRRVEAERRAFRVPFHLTEPFLKKLNDTLANAIEQLDSEDPARTARRIAFTVLNFDDSICDYQAEYLADIDQHLLANPVEGAELVFSLGKNLFDRTFAMQTATVVDFNNDIR